MLGIGSATKDGILYIPEGALEAGPLPLVVALHGATGDADNWKGWYSLADSMGFALLAIDSRDYTWDRIQGGFGADVTFLDLALAHVFDRVSIDPTRITLAGFSDGASYALSLGVSNGSIFTHLLAWSPGFFAPGEPLIGNPGIWISHGRLDAVLSFTNTQGSLVPHLRNVGYTVTFVEFDGGHTIPGTIAREGLDWALGGPDTGG